MTRRCCFEQALRQNVGDDFPVDVRETEIASLCSIGQLFVVDPQQMQNCCVQVMDVDRLLGDVVTEIIGFAVNHARLDPAIHIVKLRG